jgi:hypothetical protein
MKAGENMMVAASARLVTDGNRRKNAGPIATFRSDNMIWDFKDLSIREIQAPLEVKSNTLKQLSANTSSTYNPYIF